MILCASLLHTSRPARPHPVDEMEEDKVEEEEGHNDPMSVDEGFEELSTYMADLVVCQDDMRTTVDRRFDGLEARTERFEGWLVSAI